MKYFKEYKNLILSILSLSATLLLLIVCVLGWYVTNKEAYVTGVVGSTDGIDCDVSLSYYDSEIADFVDADSISFNNMEPGDAYYFRLACESGDGEIDLEFVFDGIKSSLNETFLIENEKLYISYPINEKDSYNIPLYNISDNKVNVNDKTLYSYNTTTSTFSLGNYLIEDTILFYDLGNTWTSSIALDDLTGKSIKNPQYVITVDEQVSYHYFALEFNDKLSTVKVKLF